MDGKKKVYFCTVKNDEMGVKALKTLKNHGYNIKILKDGELALPVDIAFFTLSSDYTDDWGDWSGQHLRLAGYRLNEVAPQWAKTTPLKVSILAKGEEFDEAKFRKAVIGIAGIYEELFTTTEEVPKWFSTWFSQIKDGDKEAFKKWQSRVKEAVGDKIGKVSLRASKKKLQKRKQWELEVLTKPKRSKRKIQLSENQREFEAKIIALIGAFDEKTGLTLLDSQLHSLYQRLLKRLALVAEAAKPRGGAELFRLIQGLEGDRISREKTMPLFEAILLYGRPYEQLSPEEKIVANEFQIADEQSHFSRIMDVDELQDWSRAQSGLKVAGNPLIARMLLNAARKREELGIKTYYPLRGVVEAANYRRNPLEPFQVKKKYPHIACVISASKEILARDLMEMYRRLIVSAPLEIVFLMLEEWLTSMGVVDLDLSFTAAQIMAKDERYEAKLINVGGGAVIIRGSENQLIRFETSDGAVGQIDLQLSHQSKVLPVKIGDEIFLFPKTELPIRGTEEVNYSRDVVIAVDKSIRPVGSFEWRPEYIRNRLQGPVNKLWGHYEHLMRVDIDFGHVHADRDPGEDQKIGAMIAGVLAGMFKGWGKKIDEGSAMEIREAIKRYPGEYDTMEIETLENGEKFLTCKIQTRPVIDNYHVIDRIDVKKLVAFLEKHSGLKITEINFEDALIWRHLGDEIIALLFQNQPQNIIRQGSNWYYKDPKSGTLVELYAKVTNPEIDCGVQGCVPAQLGYELYRLNPDWMNEAYRKYILERFPDSLVAQWWKEEPQLPYQELILKHVYSLPCEERMVLKEKIDKQIDRPFKQKSQEIISLHDLIKKPMYLVLFHILENFYDAQELKSTTLWQSLAKPSGFLFPWFPWVDQYRISFDRYTGRMKILDWNRSLQQIPSKRGRQPKREIHTGFPPPYFL